MSDILTCPNCQAKNRVKHVPAGQVPVCARCAAPLPWLHDGSDASFQDDIQASVPVLVDFWAPWCGPCRVMGPILEEIAHEQAGKVRIVKVNVDDHPRAPGQFQVQGIPTMIIFRKGQPVDRIVGATSKQAVLQKLQAAAQAN